jgi:hypothetical protein
MGDPCVISILRQKRAEISGIIASLEKEIHARRGDLAHVDATLRLFAPGIAVDGIKPKLPAVPRSQYFDQGELSERCRVALRDAAEPVNVEDIARAAMVAKGIDPEDRRVRADFCKRLRWPLERMRANGTAIKAGIGPDARWRLPAE